MTKKVALINMKGGVGKSTIAVNLAWHLSVHPNWRKKVLLVDLDPQFNASQYILGPRKYKELVDAGKKTIWHIFEQNSNYPGRNSAEAIRPEDIIVPHRNFTPSGCLHVLPSQLELAYSLINPAQKEGLLAKFLKVQDHNYDLVILDCAPTESLLTTAAYLYAEEILVPVRPEYLSAIGLPLLEQSLREFQRKFSKSPKILGIVFNHTSNYAPEEATSVKEVKSMARKYSWPILKNEVSYSRSYPKSAREGTAVFWTSYVRTTTATRFERFADEFALAVGL